MTIRLPAILRDARELEESIRIDPRSDGRWEVLSRTDSPRGVPPKLYATGWRTSRILAVFDDLEDAKRYAKQVRREWG